MSKIYLKCNSTKATTNVRRTFRPVVWQVPSIEFKVSRHYGSTVLFMANNVGTHGRQYIIAHVCRLRRHAVAPVSLQLACLRLWRTWILSSMSLAHVESTRPRCSEIAGQLTCTCCQYVDLQPRDQQLFTKATQGNHAMHHLLPSPKSTCYNLRTLGHGLSVNSVKSKLHKNTFINRLVFEDCY